LLSLAIDVGCDSVVLHEVAEWFLDPVLYKVVYRPLNVIVRLLEWFLYAIERLAKGSLDPVEYRLYGSSEAVKTFL
jgi:hypothetical protein